MMLAISRAVFSRTARALLMHVPGKRHLRLFSVLVVLAAMLGNSVAIHAIAGGITATWNANPEPDIAGYILSYGTQPGVHPTSINVGNVTTWQLTLTPGQGYYFVVQAYNTSGGTSAPSAEVFNNVAANTPPTLTQPANQTSAENASVSLPLVASDPDGDPVTYSATGLPASLRVNAASGLISGTLTFTSAGSYSVTATASDGSLTNSKTFTWTVTMVPNITGLSQVSGPVGMPVTISGSNFGTPQGTSTVIFNGAAAATTSWSATSIVVLVPAAATTGPVVVTVGGVASNGIGFTVTASAPTITSLSQTSGPVGMSVTISGTNFGSTQSTSTDTFNGTAGAPTSWSAVSILVPVPVGATTGSVVVTVGGLASNAVAFTVFAQSPLGSAQNFGILGASMVTNTGSTVITGDVGVSPGTAITGFLLTNVIEGPGTVTAGPGLVNGTIHAGGTIAAAAQTDAGLAYGALNAMACPSGNNLSGQILGTAVLSLPPGVYCFDTSAQLTGTLSLTGGGPWAFNIGTTLTTASNSSIVVVGAGAVCSGANVFWQVGTSATIGTGTQFVGNILAAASITVATGVSVSGSVLALTGAVTMDTNNVSACLTQTPTITGLSQTSGLVATPVTIAGANFGSTQGTSTVTFNGTVATPTSWSAASIVVSVPGAATTGAVVVTVGGVASNGINFTVIASAPSLTSLNPTSGAVGSAVTIAGANFGTTQDTSTVTFNGTVATPTSWSAASIVVPVPSAATTGPVVVTVGGVASNGLSFTVVPASGAITLTQHANINTSGTSAAVAFPSNNVAGNFIAVAVRAFLINQTITVSDSRGNVYQQAVKFNNNADDTVALYYAQNIVAGANTVTVAVGASATIRFAVLEYAGVAASNALDVTATSTLSGVSPTSGTATTTASGDLLIGVFSAGGDATFTAGSGYTIREAVPAAPATRAMVEDKIQTAAGPDSATAALGASDSWGAGLAAFRKAGPQVATLTSPMNGATNVDMTQPMQWTTVGVAQAYYLYVGLILGTNDLVNTGEIQQTSYLATGLPGNQTVFARLWTKLGGVWLFSDSGFTTAAATVPVVATLISPVNGATNVDMTQPMQWTTIAGAQAYYLYVGSTLGGSDLVNTGEIPQTSYLAAGLPAGRTVFARLWTKLGGVWRFSDSSFTTAP
jgi:hypothetical protein